MIRFSENRWLNASIIAWIASGYAVRVYLMGLVGLIPFCWFGTLFDAKLSIERKIGMLVLQAGSAIADSALIAILGAVSFAGIGILFGKILELPLMNLKDSGLKRKQQAAAWARAQPDLDLAEDDLLQQIRELHDIEEKAWLEFKRNWKPGVWMRFVMVWDDFFGGNRPEYCREMFLRSWQRDEQQTLHARLNAVRAEIEYLRRRQQDD